MHFPLNLLLCKTFSSSPFISFICSRFALSSRITVFKGILIPSWNTEAQSCHPLSHLLPSVLKSPWPFRNGSFSQFQSRRVPRPSIRWVKIYYSPLEIGQEMREKNLRISVIFLKKFFFMAVPLEMLVCLPFGIRKLLSRVTSTATLFPGKVFPRLNRI